MTESVKPHWKHLNELASTQFKLTDLVEHPDRQSTFSIEAAGLTVDCTRNLLDNTVLTELHNLLDACDFEKSRQALFSGDSVNFTEQRPALHMALRHQGEDTALYGSEICDAVKDCQEKMAALVKSVHSGQWKSSSGDTITDVVNIGIGGSDLGPRMVSRSLQQYHKGSIKVHFVANVDPADLDTTLEKLSPASTLFIICSKSFSTQETLLNANRARQWLAHNLESPDFSKHFIGITTNRKAAIEFGLSPENLLPMWDWVGGRYSTWSAIGLSVMMAIGITAFDQLLKGAREMDQHFYKSPTKENAPVLLALLSIWYTNFKNTQTHALVPYSSLMEHFPAYCQQLVMESNGKSASKAGNQVSHSTSPVVWGYIGSNSQHSFHQLLHQGTQLCPIDFILPIHNDYGSTSDQQVLTAHCLAQMQALLQGKNTLQQNEASSNESMINQHKFMPGNRPSTLISMPQLDAYHLGALIALYEHKTFVESCLWQINAFDQWGVELGKVLSSTLIDCLKNPDTADVGALDASTKASLKRVLPQNSD